ncbi:MAG: CinA family nicotinamide mononucleotide deamidase-related protein, partial [Actinomycetota bacterium]
MIGVGTELLLGQIANTNAQHISRALATIGVDVYFHSVVGDNLTRAAEAVRHAMDRSDAVVITGGLGPTPDDLTREAAALATGRELVRDERLATLIKEIFERMGREMPEENLKQADLPMGATPIEPEGTAPGFHLEHDAAMLFALPGVPWEMRAMLEKTVLPVLRERSGDAVLLTRQILVVGLGESATHQRISALVAAQGNPTIAFLAGRGHVRVRITAKAPDERGAGALIDPLEREIRERLGDFAVSGEGQSIAQALGSMLRARSLTIAAAESLTGGLIGSDLTETEGASDFFLGSLVA